MVNEIEKHLSKAIIPFWSGLKDEENGGFYGLLTKDLVLEKEAVKGCILNSRILWFFANAYMLLNDENLLREATHAYVFLKNNCLDEENGGVYWSVTYDGKPLDTMKHTYNQAFAIYALSSYYDASKDEEALKIAFSIFNTIEDKCRDSVGYMEAFSKEFKEISNDALSENGIIAKKTMNTMLHLLEAYTELYRVSKDVLVRDKLISILDTFEKQIYNPKLTRLEVFFDENYISLIDLHSYGHDIEASWLIDRALDVLNIKNERSELRKITDSLAKRIYDKAYDGHSVLNECENGVDNIHRIWWIQAESVVGFVNAYQKDNAKSEYLDAASNIWTFIKDFMVDKRKGSEWFWEVDENGNSYDEHDIVEPWKCPYHNGRMCIEVIKRLREEKE